MKKQLKTLFVLLSLVALPLMAQVVANSFYSSPTIAAAVQVKTGYVQMYDASMFNNSAGTVYFMLFDTNAVPANGTTPSDVPVQVPSGSTGSISYRGRPLTYGLYLAASSTPTNLTVLTTNAVIFSASFNAP